MRQAEYEAYLRKRGFGDGTVKYSVGAVRELEGALAGKALNTIGVGELGLYRVAHPPGEELREAPAGNSAVLPYRREQACLHLLGLAHRPEGSPPGA